ncbi:MAG: hypothetical protein V1934_08295 [Methanobacteriota archaeon]
MKKITGVIMAIVSIVTILVVYFAVNYYDGIIEDQPEISGTMTPYSINNTSKTIIFNVTYIYLNPARVHLNAVNFNVIIECNGTYLNNTDFVWDYIDTDGGGTFTNGDQFSVTFNRYELDQPMDLAVKFDGYWGGITGQYLGDAEK